MKLIIGHMVAIDKSIDFAGGRLPLLLFTTNAQTKF